MGDAELPKVQASRLIQRGNRQKRAVCLAQAGTQRTAFSHHSRAYQKRHWWRLGKEAVMLRGKGRQGDECIDAVDGGCTQTSSAEPD